jgi:hypothetical protein
MPYGAASGSSELALDVVLEVRRDCGDDLILAHRRHRFDLADCFAQIAR